MKCKYCGAEIIFIETSNGQKMPCEAKQVDVYRSAKGKRKAMTAFGEIFRCDMSYSPFVQAEKAYLTHWGNCRNAGWEKKRK